MFLKRVSRVSCSSCPAWIHLLSLDVTHLIRDPSSQNKLFNLGTNQRALRLPLFTWGLQTDLLLFHFRAQCPQLVLNLVVIL
jgi:hypothetical protein